MTTRSIWIGWDPREAAAFAVARHSIKRRMTQPIRINALVLDVLRTEGVYTREHEARDGQLWDKISEAPMSTEFAISRFLVPKIASTDWALFVDCDVMARGNVARIFDQYADPQYAMICVKHEGVPDQGQKMGGAQQVPYARKNWSSVCLWNVNHPANSRLTVEMVNTLPGRDLHRFCWLEDDEIGSLYPGWNWLVGHSPPEFEPHLLHFTEGCPAISGYENVPYAEEWRQEMISWASYA